MRTYYIPHKLKVGDITHLADIDSKYLLQTERKKIEDIIKVQSTERMYSAIITDVFGGSVEIEIIEEKEEVEDKDNVRITVIQSILNNDKLSLVLEKLTEIGVNEIILVKSELSIPDIKKVNKDFHVYEETIKNAGTQSRNPFPPQISRPIEIKNINEKIPKDSLKVCLSTEIDNNNSMSIFNKSNNIVIAIGPESGWGVNDLNILKRNNFQFLTLKGNILRTETSAIVVSTIIKTMKELF